MARASDLELLYQALGAPVGIVCSAPDVDHAQQKLYKARREALDPALDIIQIRTSPVLPREEIWIIKGGVIPKEEFLNAETEGD